MLHVWNIYQYLPQKWTKCRKIYQHHGAYGNGYLHHSYVNVYQRLQIESSSYCLQTRVVSLSRTAGPEKTDDNSQSGGHWKLASGKRLHSYGLNPTFNR